MELKKVVVSGSNGFIGSSLVKELLLLKKYLVVGLVRDKNQFEKFNFLKDLEGADERLLIEECGDLGSGYNFECYNNCFKGAYAVFHTASPFVLYPDDIYNDLFKPAIEGNLNLLKAALNNQSTIKKVIMISSTATIVNELQVQEVFTNEDWFDGKGLPFQYVESKYLSEKACIDFVAAHQDEIKFEVIRINPPLITGAPIDNFPSNSCSFFLNNLKEIIADKTQDPMYYCRTIVMADIKDAVKYFINALESKQSLHMERILVGDSNRSRSFKEVSDTIKSQFPSLIITQNIFSDQTLPKMPHYTLVSKGSKLINESLTPFTKSINDSVNYLINKQIIKLN
ncbi:hypothetical protein DICPUDRAFT_92755 [Dictyostelium purpureum]|uniref:3-beta hydroxysteroid dehydrogenase/isomerase domain-containing protein n=1 Tax=Dictyostelium purpureum TaxID=5786 RepID=F0ZWQ3_DICPU|nr:uncharacterized protein DICPUDRAFT_92755 [Dictyostelium purpureum]EGC31623.1 hypothetical protein DICPUDRAFT_92755 [Dictyostelium purpureum]|eukprot:XP_003291851.1 hypothetical protein DICPUDRAFT_92755 [Dictyostelium purpureum]